MMMMITFIDAVAGAAASIWARWCGWCVAVVTWPVPRTFFVSINWKRKANKFEFRKQIKPNVIKHWYLAWKQKRWFGAEGGEELWHQWISKMKCKKKKKNQRNRNIFELGISFAMIEFNVVWLVGGWGQAFNRTIIQFWFALCSFQAHLMI